MIFKKIDHMYMIIFSMRGRKRVNLVHVYGLALAETLYKIIYMYIADFGFIQLGAISTCGVQCSTQL